MSFLQRHIRHHGRFYLAALAGILAWLAVGGVEGPFRSVIAGDVFFAVYLVLMAVHASRGTPDRLRQQASVEDEGVVLIILLTLAAVGFSLLAVFSLLNQPGGNNALRLALTIASVPLGWLMLHTLAAFHYAHRYYTKDDPDDAQSDDAGGLQFPATDEPSASDFVYHAFVIGMTAQVSDIQVTGSGMRRLVLAHSIVSFFYNTVLLALAVNAAVAQAQ